MWDRGGWPATNALGERKAIAHGTQKRIRPRGDVAVCPTVCARILAGPRPASRPEGLRRVIAHGASIGRKRRRGASHASGSGAATGSVHNPPQSASSPAGGSSA